MRLKNNKNWRIKASTLVVSIVALLILSIGGGMGMMAYLNVIRADRADLKYRVKIAAADVVAKTQDNALWMDEEVSGKGYTLNKTVALYNDIQGMSILSIRVIGANGEVLYLERKIINAR